MSKSERYGVNLTGISNIYSKTKEVKANKIVYSITDFWINISEKQEDGSYINKSVKLLFPRQMTTDGLVPANNKTIKFSSFPVLTGEGKFTQVAYMVTEWEYINLDKFKYTEDEIPAAQ